MIWAVVAVVAVVVVVTAIVRYRMNQKRLAALAAWSRQRGWTMTERDDAYTARFEGTPFGTGDNRQARNILAGRFGDRDGLVFDYRYDTHTTDSKGNRATATHWFEVVALSLPGQVPTLQVGREGLFGSMARAVGFKDIELENEDFNREFKVKSPEPKFAYDVLHPRMMGWLMQCGFTQPWRMHDGDVLTWRTGRTRVEDVERTLTFLDELVGRIPRFAWDREPQA